MNRLDLAATVSTPAILADPESGLLELRGDSYPENSFQFFLPVLEWVQTYLSDRSRALRLELHLLYLNTSSVKVMMDLFDLLEHAHQDSQAVSVVWYYAPENGRIAELAEEFQEDCTFAFDIVPTPHD